MNKTPFVMDVTKTLSAHRPTDRLLAVTGNHRLQPVVVHTTSSSGDCMTLVEAPRKEFVLVVYGDPHRGRDLASKLRSLGYYATSLIGGRDALHYAAENEPDVIVTDGDLPDMSGPEFTRRAKIQSFGTRVFLVSDRTDWRLLRSTLESGGNDLLSRPLSAELLVSKLHESLEPSLARGCRAVGAVST